MKNEINAVLENMTTTIPEPEDYTGEDGLLYCGKCRKPKEAYFAPDKAAVFGRDRHPAEPRRSGTSRSGSPSGPPLQRRAPLPGRPARQLPPAGPARVAVSADAGATVPSGP